MDIEIYKNLIANAAFLKEKQTTELKSIVKEFPYFHSARALYLKGLKNQNSFRYNNELKITAAYTSNRAVLFDFITSETFEKQLDIHQQISNKISKKDIFDHQEVLPRKAPEIQLGAPINFNKNETHSFHQWLQLSTQTPIKRKTSKKIDTNYLIDRFIENNPNKIQVQKDVKTSVSIAKNKKDKSIMTETLAKVYLEQKKFSQAIKAYEILSLKYPEKSGFFAIQIKKIKNL